MSTATTTKTIDVDQLAAELGHPISVATVGTQSTVTCHAPGHTNAALQAAVDAHEPKPPPPSPIAIVQSQIDAIVDIILEL